MKNLAWAWSSCTILKSQTEVLKNMSIHYSQNKYRTHVLPLLHLFAQTSRSLVLSWDHYWQCNPTKQPWSRIYFCKSKRWNYYIPHAKRWSSAPSNESENSDPISIKVWISILSLLCLLPTPSCPSSIFLRLEGMFSWRSSTSCARIGLASLAPSAWHIHCHLNHKGLWHT